MQNEDLEKTKVIYLNDDVRILTMISTGAREIRTDAQRKKRIVSFTQKSILEFIILALVRKIRVKKFRLTQLGKEYLKQDELNTFVGKLRPPVEEALKKKRFSQLEMVDLVLQQAANLGFSIELRKKLRMLPLKKGH